MYLNLSKELSRKFTITDISSLEIRKELEKRKQLNKFQDRLFHFVRGLGDDRFSIPVEEIKYDGSSGKESPITAVQPRIIHDRLVQLKITDRFVNQ